MFSHVGISKGFYFFLVRFLDYINICINLENLSMKRDMLQIHSVTQST